MTHLAAGNPTQGSTCHQSPITNHQSPITNHQSPITNHQSPITNHQSLITNHQSLMSYTVYVCPNCYSENIGFGDSYVNAFTCSDCGCHFPEWEVEEIQIPSRVTVPPECIPPTPSLEENLDDIPF